MAKEFSVSVYVIVRTQEEAIRAMEVLQRPLLGLALEGFSVSQNVSTVDDDNLDEEDGK